MIKDIKVHVSVSQADVKPSPGADEHEDAIFHSLLPDQNDGFRQSLYFM